MKDRRQVSNTVSDEPTEKLLEKGIRFHQRGRWNRALASYNQVIRQCPGHARAHHLAGLALLGRRQTGDHDLAIRCLLRAISLDDRQAAFHNDLGSAYWSRRRIEEAVSAFLSSMELDPNFVQPNFNLGNCYWFQGRYSEALEAYRRAIDLDPGWAQAHYMIGNCLLYLGRSVDSLAAYDRAIEERKDFTDAHVGKANALLRLGRWTEGWTYFRERINYPELAVFRSSKRPSWRGEDLPQGSLLVYGEQGIGDVIQFVRFLPLLKARVGRVILACDAGLHSLLGDLSCIDELVGKSPALEDLDSIEFDRRVLLMGLPEICKTTVDTVPRNVPYLNVDPAMVDAWRRQLNPKTFNVGLVWAGNPAQKDDRHRSCPLSALSILGELPDVTLYSLQKDEAQAQIHDPAAPRIVDLGDGLTDFKETAAAISALDLLVSVDTAAAHLAGALGKPVWNLLWYAHCWRYLEERETTPWYPTMRLFRQPVLGDWESVVARVFSELAQTASRARAGRSSNQAAP